jgi:hypothetical protein
LEFILTLLHTPGNYNKISYSTKNDLFTHCLGREDGILPHRYITLPTNPHTSNMPNMAYQPTSSPPSRSISILHIATLVLIKANTITMAPFTYITHLPFYDTNIAFVMDAAVVVALVTADVHIVSAAAVDTTTRRGEGRARFGV